jgi:hypothetical protein
MAVILPLAAGEIAVRILFRDAGTATLGGPGGQEFVYHYLDPATERRTQMVTGPKAPGVERILILGDSITWGIGVRDWQQIYPNKLLNMLDHSGRRFDMDVYAYGGKNIDGHARAIEASAEKLAPDFIIYQWYNNDIEIDGQGRRWHFWWQQWEGHYWLARHSWLYESLDRLLSARAVAKGWNGQPSYVRHLLTDYREGTHGWTLFADQFHRWATYSNAYAKHVLMFLYPQVPFSGAYPLEALNARMRALARPHRLTYPALSLGRDIGQNVADASVLSGYVRKSNGQAGLLAYGPAIPLGRGRYDIAERIRLDAQASGTVEAIEIVADGRVLARREVAAAECAAPGAWSTVTVPIDLDAVLTKDVEWRITVVAGVRMSLDSISLPVSYDRLEVLDLKDLLNTFDTHASIFDSHPNARAHAEVAKALAEWVLSKKS